MQECTTEFMVGTKPHLITAVIEFLIECINARVIALNYSRETIIDIDWPPYSPEINPSKILF